MSLVLVSEENCQKCGKLAHISNRKEVICDDCFNLFMRGKIRKLLRSDVYKINSKLGVHKILLAFSGDANSISCFDMVKNLLLEQYDNYGKTGFEVILVNIVEDPPIAEKINQLIASYKDKGSDTAYELVELSSFLKGKDMKRIGIDKKFNILIKDEEKLTIEDIIESIPNKSAVEDFMEIMYEHILMDVAKEKGCGTILYCNSMNKLSSSILANLVKGRGSNLSTKVNDIENEGLSIKNPLREVFDHEIAYYVKINRLDQFVRTDEKVISNINKNMTIKQITSRYLKQLETNGYASTIPTVVKITEKLVEPSKYEPQGRCRICHEVIYQNPKQWLSKITVNEAAPLVDETERNYLEAYLDLNGSKEEAFNVSNYSICYGCMVSMNGAENILWPSEKQQDQQVLDEFIIDSDEE